MKLTATGSIQTIGWDTLKSEGDIPEELVGKSLVVLVVDGEPKVAVPIDPSRLAEIESLPEQEKGLAFQQLVQQFVDENA